MSGESARTNTTGTARSRAALVRPAVRKATKARLALSGASGAGKTWTALSIMEVICPPPARIVLIDSEPSDESQSAAELYADHFEFEIIRWEPPYDPRDLALTVRDFGSMGIDGMIIDSASHFWRGQGGTLDIANSRFAGWGTATPAQDDLVNAILRAPFHVICCMRAKQSYEVEEEPGGRQTVRKLGLAPIQRDDLEYEFQVVAMIDSEHRIDIGKTRCADLAGSSFPANQQAQMADVYKAWLDRGPNIIRQGDADLIVGALNRVTEKGARQALKLRFGQEIGVPNTLDVEKLGAAWAWLSAELDVDVHPYVETRDEGDEDGATVRCATCGLGAGARWHGGGVPAEPGTGEAPAADAVQAPGEPAGGDDTVEPPAQDEPGDRTVDAEEPPGAVEERQADPPESVQAPEGADQGEQPPVEGSGGEEPPAVHDEGGGEKVTDLVAALEDSLQRADAAEPAPESKRRSRRSA